jgi:hypothetical protein
MTAEVRTGRCYGHLFSIPFTQVCHGAREPISGNVPLSNRGIAKDAPSFIQRALYNGMDQGSSATTLEREGATRS